MKNGGRVRRKSLGGGKYVNVCFKGGKSVSGTVKQKLGGPRGTSKVAVKKK